MDGFTIAVVLMVVGSICTVASYIGSDLSKNKKAREKWEKDVDLAKKVTNGKMGFRFLNTPERFSEKPRLVFSGQEIDLEKLDSLEISGENIKILYDGKEFPISQPASK